MPRHLNTAGDFEMVPISRLIVHERNVNHGDFGAIHESIAANGFFGALVVQRGTRKILAGNHRYAAAKELGYSELPVTWVDVDDEAALRILLADNRTARLGNDDPDALAELLSELAATDKGLAGTGFDGGALDQLIADLASPDEFPSITPNTKHAMTLWYDETDEDAIKSFIGESGPDPIDPKRGGGQVLERIKTIAQTQPRE